MICWFCNQNGWHRAVAIRKTDSKITEPGALRSIKLLAKSNKGFPKIALPARILLAINRIDSIPAGPGTEPAQRMLSISIGRRIRKARSVPAGDETLAEPGCAATPPARSFAFYEFSILTAQLVHHNENRSLYRLQLLHTQQALISLIQGKHL